MATRLMAEMLLEKVNAAEKKSRRDKQTADHAMREADRSASHVSAVLDEAALQQVLFDYDRATGIRSLIPPNLGWDDERGGRVVELGK